jgi:hypothetical protein
LVSEPIQNNPPPRWRPWTSGRWKIVAFGLAMELVVVFVGVYAASAISDYQRRKQDDVRRHQIRQALISEITGITNNTRRAARSVRMGLMEYDTLIKLKRFPRLQPFLEPVRFQTHMWEATLQSGALELFDVPTVYRISEFYNQLNDGFEQLNQLRSLSEQFLLPTAEAPVSEFWDLERGRIRGKYRWYLGGQRELLSLAEDITSKGDSLLIELRSQEEGSEKSVKADSAK